MSAPAHVGPYLLERELGRGGMGVVYLARDTRLDRAVAIKALAPALAGDPARVARFRAEARLVAQLNHPHIAQIHDVREEDGRLYLVLEYVPGESLADRLQRGPLEREQAFDVCVQVARAVGAAHARGVVHRDLKPDNIRITPEGTAKVLDFGIAKALQGDAPEPDAPSGPTDQTTAPATHAGTIMGTPGYMSPEQARGRAVEKRADVWAFGCILYECLAGSRAFHGPSVADTLAATLIAEPKWTALPGGTPPAVVSLLHRCLVKDVQGRLADIAEASDRLDEALGRRATPDSHPTLIGPPPRATPNNLPRQFTAFIGRQDQLAALRPLVDRCPLVTLTGAGGCGKTRLALRLAAELLPEFPGGVHIAALAALTDPALVPSAVAGARGDRERPGEALPRSIAASIGDARAMLILDNCEHLRAACAALSLALLDQCPNLRIVATGREALGVPGETTWRVPSLSSPPATPGTRAPTPPPGTAPRTSGVLATAVDQYESVALFCDRARAVKPQFALTPATGPVVASICRRLDGIPLAIELAAARIKLLTPEQVLAKLDDRFRLLTGGGAERQQTLRATIDWSYDMLTADEAALLLLLSVFAGGWTLEDAAGVGGLDEFEVLELLTRLVDKSLVVVEEAAEGAESRYRLLESVRQYAAQKQDQAGKTAHARDRHQEFFLALAEAAAPALQGHDAKARFDRLEAEHENLLAAVAHGQGSDKPVRLAMALGRYWHTRGYAGVGAAALRDALARGGSAVAPAVRARALNISAVLAYARGDPEASRAFQTETLAIYRQLGDRSGEAASLNNLGGVTYNLGEFDAATRLFHDALAINTERANKPWMASNLSNLGIMARSRGDLDEADRRNAEALAIHRETGNSQGAAGTLEEMGLVARARGRIGQAAAWLAQSLEIRRALDDRNGLACSLHAIAGLAASEGSARASVMAACLFGAAERLREEIGAPLPAVERERHQHAVAASKAALADAEFCRHWASGRDGALADALDAAAAWLAAAAAGSP